MQISEGYDSYLDERSRGKAKKITNIAIYRLFDRMFSMTIETMETLKSPNPRNRNSISLMKSKFLSVSSMTTLLAILKVTDARRDVILAGGLYHRFPWRHLPPPPLVKPLYTAPFDALTFDILTQETVFQEMGGLRHLKRCSQALPPFLSSSLFRCSFAFFRSSELTESLAADCFVSLYNVRGQSTKCTSRVCVLKIPNSLTGIG